MISCIVVLTYEDFPQGEVTTDAILICLMFTMIGILRGWFFSTFGLVFGLRQIVLFPKPIVGPASFYISLTNTNQDSHALHT